MQAELLEALEVEHKKQETKKAAKKKKKAALKASGGNSDELADDVAPSIQQKHGSDSSSPVCTQCALLQDVHKGKSGKLCSDCAVKKSRAKAAQQSYSPPSSQSVPSAIKVLHSHSLHTVLTQSPRRVLERLCTGSISNQSSNTNSLPQSPNSKGAADTGTPDSQSSQQTDDGWEVQQRSKRAAGSLSDKHSFDSNSSGGQSRSSRSSHGIAWQPVSHTGAHVKEAIVHQGHGTSAGQEVLHLSTGPVSYQPPPPPPPPRARAAPTLVAPAKTAVAKHHFSTGGNAWGTAAKQTSASHATANAWASAVHQVRPCSSPWL